MNNEPVAYVDNVWINRPDLAMDLGIGQMFSRCQLSDHQIPLYTHPVKEHDMGISHAIGFDDGFKAGMQRAVEMNVVKELTDEEILKMAADKFHYSEYKLVIDFARAILRKAQE